MWLVETPTTLFLPLYKSKTVWYNIDGRIVTAGVGTFNAWASGKVGAGIEAKAAVFTARGGVQFEIFDTQIEVGASVSALSAGFQFGVGIKDGEFYYKSGFAVLFGYDFYIRIKFA